MSAPTDPKPTRPGLPLWIKILLIVGAIGMVLGFVLTVLPIAIMLWLMGSGDQVDTRAVASPSSVAVLHFEPDPDDPGVAALYDYYAETLPELQGRMRRAQGYPSWLAQLEAMNNARNAQVGMVSMMPTQATLTVEPADPDDPLQSEPTLMGAVNLPSWGRGIRLGMWFASRTFDELAEADEMVQPMQRVEVSDETLYVQRDSSGEGFWGAVESTVIGGSGSFHAGVKAMERLQADPPPTGDLDPTLQAAVDQLGGSSWELWGVMRHEDDVVDVVFPEPEPLPELSAEEQQMIDEVVQGMLAEGGGEIPEGLDVSALSGDNGEPPERSCLADLEGAGAAAFGVDVVDSDEVRGRVAVRMVQDQDFAEAQGCMRDLCTELADAVADSELAIACELYTVDQGVGIDARLTGMEAAVEAFLVKMEEEMAKQQQARQELPVELYDLPELEELGY